MTYVACIVFLLGSIILEDSGWLFTYPEVSEWSNVKPPPGWI